MFSSILIISIISSLIADPPQFRSELIDDNISIGYGLAIGDVDGDRKPDILLADKKEFVWYRNGDWKRFVMIKNLTESDNVCIAARDVDGDGKVEVAVGAQWNPGETSDTVKSGSVHYLIRPDDPTQQWTPVKLHHEPTIHRMRWVKATGNQYHLIVVPLHGRGNKNGEGDGVKIFAYQMPKDPQQSWTLSLIDASMHLTHNLDVVPNGQSEQIFIGGKEGIKLFSYQNGKWQAQRDWFVNSQAFGEVRVGKIGKQQFITGVEPMHGNELTVYFFNERSKRIVLTSDLKQGHALATGDFVGKGMDQVVIGWREPNSENKVGIKIFVPNGDGTQWTNHWVDENMMACEDLQIADLNDDGKKDIIAAGRATHNLKIYWGR
jgi:hypothetical protein